MSSLIYNNLNKIQFDPITFCWNWMGATNSGYGRLGTKQYVHRVFFNYWKGKIPSGFVLDHLCRNTICVNPSHLEIVTRGENVRRGIRKTYQKFCVNGHPYNTENTIYFNGKKQKKKCRVCYKEHIKKIMEKRRLVLV